VSWPACHGEDRHEAPPTYIRSLRGYSRSTSPDVIGGRHVRSRRIHSEEEKTDHMCASVGRAPPFRAYAASYANLCRNPPGHPNASHCTHIRWLCCRTPLLPTGKNAAQWLLGALQLNEHFSLLARMETATLQTETRPRAPPQSGGHIRILVSAERAVHINSCTPRKSLVAH